MTDNVYSGLFISIVITYTNFHGIYTRFVDFN